MLEASQPEHLPLGGRAASCLPGHPASAYLLTSALTMTTLTPGHPAEVPHPWAADAPSPEVQAASWRDPTR